MNQPMLIRYSLAGLLLVAVFPVSARAQPKQQIAGIYSDLAYNKESGDLNGTEVFIVLGAGTDAHYVAFVQESEGQPADPVIAPVVEKGGKVSVRARFADNIFQFDGKISKTGFDGTLTMESRGGKMSTEPFHLLRKKSYWEGP
jgi:hypothetical protein